jgi:hypothetical protein
VFYSEMFSSFGGVWGRGGERAGRGGDYMYLCVYMSHWYVLAFTHTDKCVPCLYACDVCFSYKDEYI